MASFSEIDLILAGEELNSLIPKETLPSKVDRLQTRKQEKISLPTVASHGHLMNSLSAEELQAELSHVVDQQLFPDGKGGYYEQRKKHSPDGGWEFEKIAFTDKNKWGQLDTRNLYVDGTEDGNFKLGIARTDQGGYEGRYNPDLHPGRNMGNRGVTTEDGSFLNIILPSDVATRFEHLIHMNQGQIRNRAIGTGPITQQHRDDFGSGMTEYTTPNAPLWNIDYKPKNDPVQLRGTTLLPRDIKVSTPFPEIIGGPFMKALKQRESSGDYRAVNEYGFSGAYQMGAAVLSDLGYVRKGSRNSDLSNPDTWTGKNGIDSLDAFLLNPAIQDRAAQKHIRSLTRQLRNSATDQNDLNGRIFAAWLLGVRGSKDLNATDANGTTGQEYYDIGAGILVPTPTNAGISGPIRKGVSEPGLTVGNTLLALPAGMTNIAIGTADWIVEGVGELLAKAGHKTAGKWDVATESEKIAMANNLVNYDNRRTLHNVNKIRDLYDVVTKDVELMDPETWKNLTESDNLKKIGKMFQTAFQTPEQALYSLGYMLPALFSIKTKVGAKIAKTLNDDTLSTTVKEAKVATIKEEASAADIAKYLAAKNAGIAVIAGDMTNNQLDEWIVNNKEEDPDLLNVAQIFAINLGLLIPDIAVTKFALNPKSLNAALRTLPDKKLHRFIQHSALTVTRLTAAGMGELAQEYAQTLGEVFNTKYDSEKYEGMTATEILTSPEALKKATVGGIMGAAGGVHMATPGAVLDTVVNLRDNVAGAAIDAIAGRGTKRLTPKEAMANVDTIAQDLKKAKAADTITDDLRFGEFDATKTYPEEDIHTLIEEMVARPKDFPNEPGKTQFFQNNKEVIGKTIQNIKGKESERQTKIDAIIPSQTATEDKMIDERSFQDIEDDEIKASQSKMADSITKAKEGGKTQEELVESVNNSKMNQTEKEAVLKIVEGVFTPAEEKNVRKAVEKFKKLNLGAGIVFEALEWQTDKQKALDSVLDTRVATRPTPNRKRKRLISMADNDFFNLVIKGDMSAMESQAVDSKITRDVLQKLDRNIPKNYERHRALETFNDTYLDHLLRKDTEIEIVETAAPEDRAAVALRLAVVAVNQVHSSTVSSLHEALNADAVRMPGATAKYKVAAQIGKDFVHSYGLTLQGGNKDNPAAYTKLGLQGLKLLEALGLIDTEKTRGEIYNTSNVVDEDNRLVGPKKLGLTTDADIETGEEVTTGPVVALVDGIHNEEADLFRTLKPLLNIGNVEIPHSHPLDADEEIITDKPGLSEVQEEALRDLINKPMQIKRSMLKMFDEWKRDYDIAISNGETLVSFINKNRTLKGFLDIQIVPKHSFLKESVEGSNWAKMQNFRDLIDNWDELGNIDDKYFEYKVDVNERISLINNVLNFQHDKVMSRNLVTSSVMNTTTTKKELDFLVSEIMDESALSGKAILNSGVDPILDNLVESFNDDNYGGRRQILKSMQTKGHPFYGAKSGFKVYSLLEGISDIRNRDGYKISTQYNPGADASASGVMNTLVNVIGLSKNDAEIDFLKEMLTKFGVYFGGIKPKGERSDPYKETIKATQANDKNATKILAQLKNLGISLRNLAKPTVMTWFYGASDPKVAAATGELVALEVYKRAVNGDVEAETIIRSIPGLEKTLLIKMTAKEFAILSEHFRDELGDSMIIELKKLFPQVVEYRSIMKDRQGKNVFDMLKVLFGDKWKGTFPGAVTPTLGGESTDPGANISVKKDKNVLMKEAEILVDEDDETTEMPPLLAYLPMDNPTSMAVSPQHSQDSAQNMSSSTVMTNGHQTIHDAKYGTVKDILKARVDQNRTYISLATDYDYLEQALSIFKTFGPDNVEEGKKETYERFVAYLEGVIAKSQEIKANLIGSDSYAEVFGLREDQLFDVDSVPIVKNPPKKSPETTGLIHPSEFGGLMGRIDGRTTLNSLKNILVEYAEMLNIDQEHVDMLNNAYAQYGKGELPKLKISDKFNWNSDTKGNRVIEIDPYNKSVDTTENATRFIELVLHGLEYDLTANYIASEKGTKSPEVKYMRAVVKRLKRNFNPKTANPDLRGKIEYILSGDDTRAIQELTAVLRAEPKYAEEISKIIHHRTVKSFVSTLLQAVKKGVLKAFKFNSDKDISMENTIAALELLRRNGKNIIGSGSSPKKTVQEKKPTTKKTVQEKKPTTKKTVQEGIGFFEALLINLEEAARDTYRRLVDEKFTEKMTLGELKDILTTNNLNGVPLRISQDHLDMLKDAYAQYDKGELPKLKIGNKFNWSSDAKGDRVIEIDPYNKSATTAENTTRFIELLLHEMEHDLTANYIASKEGAKSPEVKYMRSVVKRLKKEFNPERTDKDSKERIEYILSGNETRAVQELTAVLRAEPQYAEEISRIIYGRTVKSFASTLLRAAKKIIIRAFKRDKNKEITIENTVAALELLREHGKNVIAEGNNAAGPVKAEPVKESNSGKKNKQDEEDISIKADNSLIGVIDTATAGMLGVVVVAAGKVVLPLAKEGHRYLMNNTELYKGAANLIKHGVWDSVLVRQLKNTLGVDDTLDDKTLRELLGIGTDMEQKSYSIITENTPKLTAGIAKVFKTDAEKAKLRKIYAKTSIAHVLANAALEKRLLGNETIEEIVADYKLSPKMEGYAKELSKFYVTGITGKGNMTNSGKVPTENAEAQVEFDEYVALLSLQSIDSSLDMIRDMHAKDSELYDTIKSATLTVRATSDLVNGVSGNLTSIDYTDYHGNYILDITEKPYEYKLVAPGTTNALKYSKDDAWKQIENNGKEGYDLFVREKELGFISKGVGISTNRFTNGYPLKTKWVEEQIALDSAFITKNNISKTFVNNNERYILNIKEAVKEKELSMVNDLADSLYNTIVHNKELQEMKTITDIIKRKAITTVGSKNINSLVKDIRRARLGKDTTRPIPMFLKINYEELGYDFKLPNELIYYYKVPDTSKVSTYDGFNEHLDLIRKDAEHILLDSEPNALFKQGSVARKVETVYRHLVSKLKLSIISNPIKLMGDIAANSVLLADVPLETITKHAKEYTEELDKLSVLRNEMIGLELQEVMEPGKHRQRIKILNKRIKESKMYPALEHGFIQSLSTNMLLKDFESIRGLQADVDELVGHLVGKKEKRTVIGKLVKKLSTAGFQGEDILSFLARISGKKNKTLGDEFEAMADRLKNMKDSDDLVRYVSEYLGMPSSELVRQSSNIMTNIDGVARWIMYNNLINLGHTEDYAARTALETFIDYRRNLPEVIKLASDLGLMLFPNFWMKYQRVLFNLIKNNPASSTISYTIDQLLGMGSMHPFDASIFSKVADGTVVGVVDPLDEKIYNPWWWMFQ